MGSDPYQSEDEHSCRKFAIELRDLIMGLTRLTCLDFLDTQFYGFLPEHNTNNWPMLVRLRYACDATAP
jgi:hypothetical protein